jgi:hypothetical protein
VLCRYPFQKGGFTLGCGRCLPCRIRRRRIWTHRMMIESLHYENNCFVTLTYKDMPLCTSICKTHLRNFIKRLRRKIEPMKIRFYAVAEYGDKNLRPHYHLLLFGYPNCVHGRSKNWRDRMCDCVNCQIIYKTWNRGLCELGELNKDSIQYAAGYILKKLTKFGDARLAGREPEFARMSNRPGIGLGPNEDSPIISQLVKTVTDTYPEYLEENLDVPSSLNHGGKSWPLGEYLKRKMRKEIFGDDGISPLLQNKLHLERELLIMEKGSQYYEDLYQERIQKCINVESKYKRFKKERNL